MNNQSADNNHSFDEQFLRHMEDKEATMPKKKHRKITAIIFVSLLLIVIGISVIFGLSFISNKKNQRDAYLAFAGQIISDTPDIKSLPTSVSTFSITHYLSAGNESNRAYYDRTDDYLKHFLTEYNQESLNFSIDAEEFYNDAEEYLSEKRKNTDDGLNIVGEEDELEIDSSGIADLDDALSNQIASYYLLRNLSINPIISAEDIYQNYIYSGHNDDEFIENYLENDELLRDKIFIDYIEKNISYNSSYSMLIVDLIYSNLQSELNEITCSIANQSCPKDNLVMQRIEQTKIEIANDIADMSYKILATGAL